MGLRENTRRTFQCHQCERTVQNRKTQLAYQAEKKKSLDSPSFQLFSTRPIPTPMRSTTILNTACHAGSTTPYFSCCAQHTLTRVTRSMTINAILTNFISVTSPRTLSEAIECRSPHVFPKETYENQSHRTKTRRPYIHNLDYLQNEENTLKKGADV